MTDLGNQNNGRNEKNNGRNEKNNEKNNEKKKIKINQCPARELDLEYLQMVLIYVIFVIFQSFQFLMS